MGINFLNFLRFNDEASPDWLSSPLYFLLSRISYTLGLSVYGANASCTLFFLFGLYSLLIKLTRPWLALCVFYPYYILVFSFNFDRQSAALGIAFFAFSRLLDSKRLQYFLLLLIGALFHPTILILAPLTLVTDSITRKKYLVFVLFTSFLFYLLSSLFYDVLVSNVVSLSYNYFLADTLCLTGLWLRLLPLVLSSSFLFVFRRYLNLSKFQYNAYSCLGVMILLLSIISFFSLSFSTVVDRLSAYASPLLIFAASESPAVLKRNGLAHSLVVGSIVIYSFLLTLAWLSASTMPSTTGSPSKYSLSF